MHRTFRNTRASPTKSQRICEACEGLRVWCGCTTVTSGWWGLCRRRYLCCAHPCTLRYRCYPKLIEAREDHSYVCGAASPGRAFVSIRQIRGLIPRWQSYAQRPLNFEPRTVAQPLRGFIFQLASSHKSCFSARIEVLC
jgi:hypothetical protein